MTDQGAPGKHKVRARGNAVNFVKDIINKGYKVVVSSAWDKFDETLDRLKKLGLEETLQINSPSCGEKTLKFDSISIETSYCKNGLVASVKDPKIDPTYFRQKAFSYLFLPAEVDQKSIKFVVFADDSQHNINIFRRDRKRADLFPNAQQVDTFLLSSATGQTDLN